MQVSLRRSRRASRRARETAGEHVPDNTEDQQDRGTDDYDEKRITIELRARDTKLMNQLKCNVTLVERMGGFTGLLTLPSKHSEYTADAVIEYFHELPETMRGWRGKDQGDETPQNAKPHLATPLPVDFADLHSLRQQPSHENFNLLDQKYLPNGTATPDHQTYPTVIAEEINDGPRRQLNYLPCQKP